MGRPSVDLPIWRVRTERGVAVAKATAAAVDIAEGVVVTVAVDVAGVVAMDGVVAAAVI